MSVDNRSKYWTARPLILIVLAAIFAGFILYSAFSIKYNAGISKKSEFKITELSLTHDVIRDKNGKLVVPAEKPDISSNSKTKKPKPKTGGKACPT